MTVGTLLAEDDPVHSHLIRHTDGEWISFESGVPGRLLYVDGRDRRLEALEIRLDRGRHYTSRAHAPGTEELVICLDGTLTVGPQGDEQQLDRGDALHFAADLPHTYRSRNGCRALCIFTYPAIRGH